MLQQRNDVITLKKMHLWLDGANRHDIWWDYVTSTTVQKYFIGAMFYVLYI